MLTSSRTDKVQADEGCVGGFGDIQSGEGKSKDSSEAGGRDLNGNIAHQDPISIFLAQPPSSS